MQEEANRSTAAIIIQSSRISADILRYALRKVLEDNSRIERGKNQKDNSVSVFSGKQSVEKLSKGGHKLSAIEITDKNIRSFEKVARKYEVSYALKKDVSRQPPRYIVFFRAKDYSQMKAAFNEYVGRTMSVKKKPSLLSKLAKLEKEMSVEMVKAPVKKPELEVGGR